MTMTSSLYCAMPWTCTCPGLFFGGKTLNIEYMKMALELAQKGCGHVAPNPMVGAVIVKDGRIIGKGYHRQYGMLHAEREALADCSESPEGAEMYVTLEPCCHYGKQPPCTEAIIEAGISHVYVGSPDPNELVAGKGISILRSNGIQVTENVLREECEEINYVFFHYIRTGLPYVNMKYAMTMDGKTAAVTGASRWITGETARKNVHSDRNRYSGIMIGTGTLLDDDPLLTCRLPGGKDPVRIVCDSNLRIPMDSQIVKTAKAVPTIVATCSDDEEKVATLEERGCQVIKVSRRDGHTDLNELMSKLGEMKIDSILLEGGSSLNWAALKAGIINRVQAYIAPKLLGGKGAPSPVGGEGVPSPDDAFALTKPKISIVGDDILLESEVIKCSQE